MTSPPAARHLLAARDFAAAHYASPITVDDMAARAGLSRSHFSREFTRVFGETPRDFLRTRRLERSASLLRRTDHGIATICAEVGFSSLGSFTTAFRRAYGVTPSAYRARFPPAAAWARVPACMLAQVRPAPPTRVQVSTREEDGASGDD